MRPGHAETAGLHLTGAVFRVGLAERLEDLRARLPGSVLDDTEQAYVLDQTGRLQGLIRFSDLLRLPGETLAGAAMRPSPHVVHAEEDQEKVASIALHYGLNSVPVVDAEGRLLGAVPSQALLKILRHEHVEDLHRLAGIGRETSVARRALDAPPLRRARDRLPWLLIGLLGSILATFVMSRFEAALDSRLALAFFVPGLVYLADAIGTQTEAVTVRGLSLAHIDVGRLLGGELRTGLIIGMVLGSLTFPAVWLVFDDSRLAAAVAGALFVAGGLASTVGLVLPWLLARWNIDPAFGSGPLATVIQDVLTLLTYFAFVILLY